MPMAENLRNSLNSGLLYYKQTLNNAHSFAHLVIDYIIELHITLLHPGASNHHDIESWQISRPHPLGNPRSPARQP